MEFNLNNAVDVLRRTKLWQNSLRKACTFLEDIVINVWLSSMFKTFEVSSTHWLKLDLAFVFIMWLLLIVVAYKLYLMQHCTAKGMPLLDSDGSF